MAISCLLQLKLWVWKPLEKMRTYSTLFLFHGVALILILRSFYWVFYWMVQVEPIWMIKSSGSAWLKPAEGTADVVMHICNYTPCIIQARAPLFLGQNSGRVWPCPSRSAGRWAAMNLLGPAFAAAGSAEGTDLSELWAAPSCAAGIKPIAKRSRDVLLTHGWRRWRCAHCIV